MKKHPVLRIFCTILLAVPFVIRGQSTTSLRGTVTDPSGAIIPEAVVSLKNAGTGLKRQVVTGADGV